MTTETIEAFAKTADTFCRWAEGEPQDAVEDARTARALLAELILRAIELSYMFADTDPPEISDAQYKAVYKRFSSLPFQYYLECFNPLAIHAEEPVTADLADDLADVWRDLRGGLDLYRTGNIEAAVWEWHFQFAAHWGHHATGALYSLQSWFSQNADDI